MWRGGTGSACVLAVMTTLVANMGAALPGWHPTTTTTTTATTTHTLLDTIKDFFETLFYQRLKYVMHDDTLVMVN